MFNQLYDKMRQVKEMEDLNLNAPSGEPSDEPTEESSEFNQELIQELNLVSPKKEMAEYDEEQLDMGRQVEAEHTSNPDLAVVIAANHLDEIPDYYTRLKAMEEEAKEGEGLDLEKEDPSLESEEDKARSQQNMQGVAEESKVNEAEEDNEFTKYLKVKKESGSFIVEVPTEEGTVELELDDRVSAYKILEILKQHGTGANYVSGDWGLGPVG